MVKATIAFFNHMKKSRSLYKGNGNQLQNLSSFLLFQFIKAETREMRLIEHKMNLFKDITDADHRWSVEMEKTSVL